jgi:hypothetical protein
MDDKKNLLFYFEKELKKKGAQIPKYCIPVFGRHI